MRRAPVRDGRQPKGAARPAATPSIRSSDRGRKVAAMGTTRHNPPADRSAACVPGRGRGKHTSSNARLTANVVAASLFRDADPGGSNTRARSASRLRVRVSRAPLLAQHLRPAPARTGGTAPGSARRRATAPLRSSSEQRTRSTTGSRLSHEASAAGAHRRCCGRERSGTGSRAAHSPTSGSLARPDAIRERGTATIRQAADP